MKYTFLLSILGLITCAFVKNFTVPIKTDSIKTNNSENTFQFQKLLDSSVNTHKMIGVQVALKMKNGETWYGSSGTTDLDRTELLDNNHIIRVGSLSKTFTAVLILQLYEKGQISLEERINKWFPDFPESDKITVKMLLNHSSGIKEYLGPAIFLPSSFNSAKLWTQEEIYKIIKNNKLLFHPGANHVYANSNYFLLGVIAEKITGKSLKALLKNNIIAPLKLENTYFLPDEKVPATLINGYDRDLVPLPGWFTVKPENTSWSSCAFASGSMASTAKDLLSFYNALLENKLINQNSFDLMMSFQDSKSNESIYLKHFGLGLFKFDPYRGYYGHQGLFVGSEALALFNKESKSIFVILANVSTLKEKDELINAYLDKIQ